MEVKSRSEEVPPRPARRLRPVPEPDTFPVTFAEVVARSAERFGDRVFLPRRDSRTETPVTFGQLAADVRRVAGALAARGIAHGDRIGLVSENRYQWLVVDLAAAGIGAIDVPRGADTAPAEMQFILGHSGCRMVFVENDELAAELLERRADLPEVEAVCTLQDHSELPGVVSLPELMAEGEAWHHSHQGALERLAAAVSSDDILTIVYTSGTTADPKGVMLTHSNVLSNVRTANVLFGFCERDRFLSALPPWHMYERVMDYIALVFGAEMVYTDRHKLKDDLVATQPTLFAAVPRIWETIYDGIIHKTRKMSPPGRVFMQFALETCRRVGAGEASHRDRLVHKLLSATLLKRFKKLTGGRLRAAVSGGGALPDHVDQTLVGLGIPLLNGYGLTETSPVVSVRTLEDNRSGTIGPPLPETEVEIRDENGQRVPDGGTGVIWVRGPGVMRGYYRNLDRSATVLVDGWFNTGDLGRFDERGRILITGRAKDTIVLAAGENVEPERVETAIKGSPYIEQAVVVGQDRKTLGALLVVSADNLEHEIPRERWGLENGLLTSEEIRKLFRRELDAALTRERGFRSVERVARFCVMLEPMTCDNGLLTQTLKVKRHVVSECYRELIESMFS